MFNPTHPPGSGEGGGRGEETDPQSSSDSPGARQSVAMEDAVATPERGDRCPPFSSNTTKMPSSFFARELSSFPEQRYNLPRLPQMPVISYVEDGPAIVSRKQGKGGVKEYAEMCWKKVWERNLSVSSSRCIYKKPEGEGEERKPSSQRSLIHPNIYIFYTIMQSQATEFNICVA